MARKKDYDVRQPNFLNLSHQKKEKRGPISLKGMSVEEVLARLAVLKTHGDQVLSHDLRKFELRPEINATRAKAIEEGNELSPREWNLWKTRVRFEISKITQLEGKSIRPGSLEETRIFRAVSEFGKELPDTRLDLLKSKRTLLKRVLADLAPHRPPKE